MPVAVTVIRAVERLATVVGRLGSLLLIALVGTILVNIVLRYAFNLGLIELEELQWHLNAVVVMTALAATYGEDAHVRVDLFHDGFSQRSKAWIEVLGTAFLFLPFVVTLTLHAWSMAAYSWQLGEGSPMPSGLPARYVVKFVMFAGFALFGLQGVAVLIRSILVLATGDRRYAIGHALPETTPAGDHP
ncbi:TRAP transporter small permease subunit [Pinisolibacter aquiterrae]|jgi:TRAP-type mannitol/chloroaromatic compound transport system permease small subunit|uniref:TRAP transporter small permease subunit n=1 Tax=Pinisolibacter aquiterrae TaxID=2815579 RepID=UPI001C3C6FD5|nr:TRAP transporter small permease subunit [Pinisolibacter aquiterrae]MBV5265770.1 TRAP transporter small permease subunit [Pinisolibacter aquiterrae]MCC8236665.1 TRAP transporter small permease subunit [Pinisolibacter aquiterrae]